MRMNNKGVPPDQARMALGGRAMRALGAETKISAEIAAIGLWPANSVTLMTSGRMEEKLGCTWS